MAQRRSLFRQEAVEFQRQRQGGEVVLLQPLPVSVLFWAIAAAVALIVAFLLLAQYARKETVAGYLSPVAGVVKVFAARGGTIKAVHVEEGQRVEEGQPLLTVVVDQTTAGGANVDAAVLDALTRQKALLAEQIATQERRTASERERLEARIAGFEAEISHLEAQIAVQRERVRLSAGLAATAEGLRSRGLMPEPEYKSRLEADLEQRQNLGALNQQLAARRSQLTEARYALELLPAVMAEKIQLLRTERLEAEQRIAEIDGRRAYVVRAPAAGRIATLQAGVGRAADPRQPQLSILPNGSILQAELFVPTRAVGFVRPGQEVRILYDAFPYQRFGTHRGRVVKVAQTILTSADISAPVALREPAYRVIVALDRQDVTASGERRPLQADMLLRADIVLDRRPVMGWLLDPLLSARVW